jgi:hypothetical protein
LQSASTAHEKEALMEQTKEQLTQRLVAAIQELPSDKLLTVLDFVGYLQSRYSQQRPERGSAEAILHALEQSGPLQFEPGELDALLAEIEHMRETDLEAHD